MDPLTPLTKETHFYGSVRNDIPPSPAVPGNPSNAGMDVTTTEGTAEAETLKLLYTQPDQKEEIARLTQLGYIAGKGPSVKPNPRTKNKIQAIHHRIAVNFEKQTDDLSCDGVLQMLMQEGQDLKYLLAEGHEDKTVLHQLFDPETYDHSGIVFGRLKPLVRFLLKIFPKLPGIPDYSQQTPLCSVMESFSKEMAEEIVRYLCGNEANGGLASEEAIKSLTIKMYDKSNFSSTRSHALHKAIEHSVEIDEEVVKKVESLETVPTELKGKKSRTCLEEWDSTGKTCLHLALTRPFTTAKCRWAKMLIKLKPDLLKVGLGNDTTQLDTLTPFQHFHEEQRKRVEGQKNVSGGPRNPKEKISDKTRSDDKEKPDLKDLEDSLKLCCLKGFDNATARSIMYKRDQRRENYLGFEYADIVSGEILERMRRHYKLDTALRCIYIPSITVKWDDHNTVQKRKVDSWKGVGRTDLYMIFAWLKERVMVKNIIEVFVEDFEEHDRKSHSDQAIEECLRDLNIEIWNWRRMNISSDVIYHAAGENVRVVHLYCSGIKAVLQSWSDRNGLARLKNLDTIHLEVWQGLESVERMTTYVQEFEKELKKSFFDIYQRDNLIINSKVINTTDKLPSEEVEMSKVKEEGEDGYEEQDWLKCMDKFADFVEEARAFKEPAEDNNDQEQAAEWSDFERNTNFQMAKIQPYKVKVAIIDDGVKSSVNGLDDLIERGESWVEQATPKTRYSPYTTSSRGHGTVMAYYIRRVCPNVSLYVAKLNPQIIQGRVTFTIESVTKAIEWAVTEDVDIISMSWAIEEKPGPETQEVKDLRTAINKAADKDILLFCAHPDKGHGGENNTYPKSLRSDRIFCIGAANKDGNAWGKITDKTSDFYLPGVDLGIPTETKYSQRKHHPPEKWKTYSGSSLSCALAVGLAAQILYCARLVEHKSWDYLKSHKGMKQAFGRIGMTENHWLQVRTTFGDQLLSKSVRDKTERLRLLVVDKLLADRDSYTRVQAGS